MSKTQALADDLHEHKTMFGGLLPRSFLPMVDPQINKSVTAMASVYCLGTAALKIAHPFCITFSDQRHLP